ncbi:uncharacterized protein FA14DRAFT_162159 [Meira miltonrushii]|uniref:RED-like N-terminal domain-containing protein n=1 Tax=Meira miltonrushii TaxID=1280837 RepID=A0A316V6Z8_9BASI|nr:uncharacterized protein FA14DRAFT_162159 [Meira miltonrushii]PWN32964.1 hypothetical protein FA14DRAFT_162159 [Meira miltonrushii]
MDQSAFRQLVSSQGSGGSTNAGKSKRVLGKGQKRTGLASTSNKDEDVSSKFIPRKVGKNANSTEEDEEEENERARLKKLYAENYTDRAAARRSGQEELNEFHDVEMLKKDFAKRLGSANDESERQQIREQMAFLGGDAKHTVLVDGLDFALLEQQRAKMNGDDDLENAFQSTSSSQRTTEKAPSAGIAHAKNDKFKPIGSSKPKEEESPEYIWRNGKRMRKKRKDRDTSGKDAEMKGSVTEVSSDGASTQSKRAKVPKKTKEKAESSTTATAQLDEAAENDGESVPPKAPEEGAITASSKLPSSTNIQSAIDQDKKEVNAPAENSDEDDEDIFAGAGRWDGLAEDASDEDGAI